MDQQQAIRNGDRFPWMFARHDRDLAGTDLDRVFPDPNVNKALENLERHAPLGRGSSQWK